MKISKTDTLRLLRTTADNKLAKFIFSLCFVKITIKFFLQRELQLGFTKMKTLCGFGPDKVAIALGSLYTIISLHTSIYGLRDMNYGKWVTLNDLLQYS